MSKTRAEVQEVFVDRLGPLATLRLTFEKVKGDHGGAIIVIRGTRGVGKTTLVRSFLNEIESTNQDLVILRTEGREFTKTPYSALFEMFSSLLKSGSLINRSKQIAKVVLDLAKLIPAFDSLASMISGIVSDVSDLTETDRRTISNSMFVDNLFVMLFEKLSLKAPVVAFFDDVQSFDSSSFEALCFLLERISATRCFIILVFREDSQHLQVTSNNLRATLNLLSRIDSDDRFTINLNPLVKEASTKLASELARNKLTKDEVDSLATTSRGNPFIIDRTIRNLVRAEKSRENIRSNRNSLLAPENVSDPIRSALIQIQREDMHMRILLDNAAILGEKFTLDELAALMERDPVELVHQLEELELVYGVISKDTNDDEYRFDHSITREVILGGLGPSAALLHAKAAQMYELTGTNPGLAALHYDEAQRPDLAFSFYVEAAKAASKNLSFADSISYLKRGLELSKRLEVITSERRLSLFLQLGQSQFADGKFTEGYKLALAILKELVTEKTHSIVSKQLEAEAKLLLGKCCRYVGTTEAGATGIANLKSACKIFEELGDLQKLGIAYSVLSTALDHFAFRDEAILYFGKAQKTMNLSNDRIGLATLARKSGMIFDSRRAIDFISSALGTFRLVGATVEVARCQNNLGAEELYVGDFQSAKKNLNESIDIYRKINSYEVDIPLNNLGLVYIQTKDFLGARNALTEAYDRASEDFNRMCAGMNLATLDWLEQGSEFAIYDLRRLQSLVSNSGEPLIQDYFAFNLASLLLSAGNAQEALEWIEKYPLNEWKGDTELALAKRQRLKASILGELGKTGESQELTARSEEYLNTTRPQKWFYLIDYYPCDIHILD